jgi:microsomal dipeptidase-like Zn-dependent dipeptidase
MAEKGISLVKYLMKKGILLDISHLSQRSLEGFLTLTKQNNW